MPSAYPVWLTDLLPGVSEKQLKENILTYGGGTLGFGLEFILLDKDRKVELQTQSAPETDAPHPGTEVIYLCVDKVKENDTPVYTTYKTVAEYNAAVLADTHLDRIEMRGLVKIKNAQDKDVKAFFNEWGVWDKETADLMKEREIGKDFDKISSGLINTAVASGTGDAMWMALCVTLFNHIESLKEVEIAAGFLPFIIAPITAYLSYQMDLASYEDKVGRKANPAERRAFRKRAIDMGWQIFNGMALWTIGFYIATLVVMPLLGGPLGVLVGGILIGLCQAISVTLTLYWQEQREGKVDYPTLAATFVTEFVTGFAWYMAFLVVTTLLATSAVAAAVPLAAIGFAVTVAAVATWAIVTFFTAAIPYLGIKIKDAATSQEKNSATVFASNTYAVVSRCLNVVKDFIFQLSPFAKATSRLALPPTTPPGAQQSPG